MACVFILDNPKQTNGEKAQRYFKYSIHKLKPLCCGFYIKTNLKSSSLVICFLTFASKRTFYILYHVRGQAGDSAVIRS